jgi:hypothetical protein
MTKYPNRANNIFPRPSSPPSLPHSVSSSPELAGVRAAVWVGQFPMTLTLAFDPLSVVLFARAVDLHALAVLAVRVELSVVRGAVLRLEHTHALTLVAGELPLILTAVAVHYAAVAVQLTLVELTFGNR